MKKLLLIGSVGCGKTTFLQHLHGLDQTYAKTQAIYSHDGTWDTPGEFVDSLWLKHALQQASTQVDLIVFLHAATSPTCKIPPLFATYFTKPAIGVVTKTDLATPAEIDHARTVLKLTGATDIYPVSSTTGDGYDLLLPRLQ